MSATSSTAGPRRSALDPIREVDEAVRSVLGWSRGQGTARTSDESTFADRLFSLRHAEALRPGTTEIRVAPGTVVTPLAQHTLKLRGIVVRVVSRSDPNRARRQ